MSQMVRVRFNQVRQLSDGRTAVKDDVAEVPYDEAAEFVRIGSAVPCNEYGGQEAMPKRLPGARPTPKTDDSQ